MQAQPNNFSFIISQTGSWETCTPNQMIHVFKNENTDASEIVH
jgi:hypothetical protein